MSTKTPSHSIDLLAPYKALMADTAQQIQDRIMALREMSSAPLPLAEGTQGPAGSSLFDAILSQSVDSAAHTLQALSQVRPRRAAARAGDDVVDVDAREVSSQPSSRGEA